MPFRSREFNSHPEDPALVLKEKSRKFFYQYARKFRTEIRLHEQTGLLPKKSGWSNVSRHTLTEAVAADVLGEALGLSEADINDLKLAGFLHDVDKRKEIETLRARKDEMKENPELAHTLREGMKREAREFLSGQGYSPKVIQLVDSVGASSLPRMREHGVSLQELIMHYVDDITEGDKFVTLAERALELKKRYPEIVKDIEAQLQVGQQIERVLAEKVGLQDPAELPGLIRRKIRERIESTSLQEE
jgi:hypothetical protein